MLGSKQPLGQYMMGLKKPLSYMLGGKSPMSHIQQKKDLTDQLNEQKKSSGLERAMRKEGSKTLGQYA
jgi:hypothetical protein